MVSEEFLEVGDLSFAGPVIIPASGPFLRLEMVVNLQFVS
jgi:hypothetical protein